MSPLITVITPTTGSSTLRQVVQSVNNQTYKNIQHLVVIDGKEREHLAMPYLRRSTANVITLPYATGKDQYNGHRIYGAMSYVAKGDYICFLDEDNWFELNHVESLVDQILAGNQWAYSLRKIVDQEGKFICNDDCESLGKWKSVINDNFIDVNCYMIPKMDAIAFSPYWYRRARHSQEQPEVDRILSAFMMQNKKTFDTSGLYTVNYRVAGNEGSVKPEFFYHGNRIMNEKYNGALPWRK